MKAQLLHNKTLFETNTEPKSQIECIEYAQVTLAGLTCHERLSWDLVIDDVLIPKQEWI